MYYQRFGTDAEPEFETKKIDLSKFVGKEVKITFRGGSVYFTYVLENLTGSSSRYHYQINLEGSYPAYTKQGTYWESSTSHELDIIAIEEIKE